MPLGNWGTRMNAAILSAAALLLILTAAPASAQESFRATHIAQLDGANERPNPITSNASGIAIMRLDTAARRLEYRISVSNLVDARAAHFHSGRPDTVGPVIHTITLPSTFATDHTVTGVWEGISSQDIMRLSRGTIYINFHTGANPGGEIRGEVERIPNLIANMNAAEETEPVTSTGGGDALIVLDLAARKLDYLITFSGLTGPATMAHFHRGERGVAGPVAADIILGGRDGRAAGTWSNISTEDLALLLQRKIYVNIHTAAFPNGEIRAQLAPIEFYTAAISPRNEVEKPTNSQSAGTGFFLVYLNNGVTADISGQFIVDGTTGPVQNAHIHAGGLGVAGPVIRSLQPSDDAARTDWLLLPVTVSGLDSLVLYREGGIYANFHTQQWDKGELRGQLIPAQFNLLPVPSSVAESEATATGSPISVSVERNGGAISFRIVGDPHGSSRSIALYSSMGTRVAAIPVEGDHARVASDDLPTGFYIAQLVIDGRPMGSCQVMIVR